MKNNYRLILCILIFLICTACAGTNNPVVMYDQAGRKLPNPHYVLLTPDKKIQCVFYYQAVRFEEDLDGSKHPKFRFLDVMNPEGIIISEQDIQTIMFVCEFKNLERKPISIWEHAQVIIDDGQVISHARQLGKSDLPYRKFEIPLPLKNVKNVKYNLTIYDEDGEEIMNFGTISYHVVRQSTNT